MKDTERERGRDIGREKQALCREADLRLDPGTLRSCPEPKADRCSTTEPPRFPCYNSFISIFSYSED